MTTDPCSGASWLAAAVALVLHPWFVSLFLLGAAIGLAARIRRGQRTRRRKR